jgi:hypothetical protein
MPQTIRRLAPIALLLAVIAAALLISACGDDEEASADQTLKETFSGKKSVDSGKLNLNFRAELKAKSASAQAQVGEPVSVKVTGPFQSLGEDALPAMNLDLTAGSGAQNFTAGVVSTGDQGFISYQGTYYKVPDKTFREFKRNFEREQRKESKQQSPDLAALGVDAQKWLKDPKVEGTEDVGGAETTHISSDVNLDALLIDLDGLLKRADDLGLSASQQRELPKRLDRKTRQQLAKSVEEAHIDVWTGKDDKTLRQLEVHLEFKSPKGLGAEAQDIESGKIDLTLAVADLNEKQEIEAPKNARSVTELQQQLGVLGLGNSLGGSGSGSGSGSSSGSSGSSGSSNRTGAEQLEALKELSGGTGKADTTRAQDYLECAQDAQTADDLKVCGDKLK